MLSCPLHHHSHSLLLHHHRPNTTISSSLRRTHNSKSTSLLLRHLSQPQPQPQPQDHAAPAPTPLDEKEKVELLELSLVTKRTPQFPGSIYVQSPSDPDVHTSLPPLQTLFQTHTNGSDEDEEDEDRDLIMRALEIRRKVTAEIFKESMISKGKFGITYATNLTRRLSDFIDYVMVEAAAMKRLPDFSESTFNFRAKTVIDDSRVVPLIRWLKHNSVSYPKIGKLICMSKGKIESIRRVIEWLKSIHVKGEFLGVALTKSGGNILERSNEELDEIVNYLESNGVRMDWMGYVVSRCPQLLSYSMEEVRARVGFFLDMGMNEKDFGTMVFDYPRVLGYFTLEEMNEKVRFLQDIGIRDDAIGNMLVKFPSLLTCSLYKKIRPVVIFLMTRAGVNEKDIGKVIALGPELLGCSISKKLEYRYLRRTMVRPLKDLIEFPSYSLDDRIIPRHKVLVEKQINLKLRYMLACTDEEFDKKVEAIVKQRQRFEAGLLVDTLSEPGLLEGDLSDSQATNDPVESMKLSETESV
ncbi:hypothetical protein ACB098_07G121500 [Castanea mollissima]